MGRYKTYTLSCPLSGEIRYVGQTISPLRKRLNLHMTNPSNPNAKIWINSLKKKKLRPIIEELESVTKKESTMSESYWIHQFKAWGFNLLNKQFNISSAKTPTSLQRFNLRKRSMRIYSWIETHRINYIEEICRLNKKYKNKRGNKILLDNLTLVKCNKSVIRDIEKIIPRSFKYIPPYQNNIKSK